MHCGPTAQVNLQRLSETAGSLELQWDEKYCRDSARCFMLCQKVKDFLNKSADSSVINKRIVMFVWNKSVVIMSKRRAVFCLLVYIYIRDFFPNVPCLMFEYAIVIYIKATFSLIVPRM